MAPWEWIQDKIDRTREHLIYVRIKPEHVDEEYDDEPMRADRDYFRLWLSQMFLKHDVHYLQKWYPAVHSLVRLRFGNGTVEIPNIADSTRVAMRQVDSGDVIARNFALTPLMPFNGGTVELAAGLVAIKGADYFNNFIKVMGDFASLLAVPQLSAALSVAGPLSKGIEELFGAGDGQVKLGVYDTFVGEGAEVDNKLRAGYIAVVRATDDQIDKHSLRVVEGSLCAESSTEAGGCEPLQGFDYMLFRIELRKERDDWRELNPIQGPLESVSEAIGRDEVSKAGELLRAAKFAALRSPDLTKDDRKRVAEKVQQEFNEQRMVFDDGDGGS